jgi:hypothetical protein
MIVNTHLAIYSTHHSVVNIILCTNSQKFKMFGQKAKANLAKKENKKRSTKAQQQQNIIKGSTTKFNNIINSPNERQRERERKKKKPVGSCTSAPCSALRRAPCVTACAVHPCTTYRGQCHGGPVAVDPWRRGGWVMVLPFFLLWRRIRQRIELVCVVCAVVQGDFWIGNVRLGIRDYGFFSLFFFWQ